MEGWLAGAGPACTRHSQGPRHYRPQQGQSWSHHLPAPNVLLHYELFSVPNTKKKGSPVFHGGIKQHTWLQIQSRTTIFTKMRLILLRPSTNPNFMVFPLV